MTAPRAVLALAASALLPAALAEGPPYRDPNLPVESRVIDLLGRMTLEEKIAQTLALWKGT